MFYFSKGGKTERRHSEAFVIPSIESTFAMFNHLENHSRWLNIRRKYEDPPRLASKIWWKPKIIFRDSAQKPSDKPFPFCPPHRRGSRGKQHVKGQGYIKTTAASKQKRENLLLVLKIEWEFKILMSSITFVLSCIAFQRWGSEGFQQALQRSSGQSTWVSLA